MVVLKLANRAKLSECQATFPPNLEIPANMGVRRKFFQGGG